MDAGKKILLDLLTGSLRFAVPVYQRRYSWGETQVPAIMGRHRNGRGSARRFAHLGSCPSMGR